MENKFTYPLEAFSLSNQAKTRCLSLPQRRRCDTPGFLEDPCCNWNEVFCPADEPYFQPVCVEGDCKELAGCLTGPGACDQTDLLYFQFTLPDFFNDWEGGEVTHVWKGQKVGNWFAVPEVFSPTACDLMFSDYVENSWVGVREDGRTLQQIVINPRRLPPVFFLSFTFQQPDGSEKTLFTEMYRRATCEETVLVEGIYAQKGKGSEDCFGFFYGVPAQASGPVMPYRNQFRLPGSFEFDTYEIDREIVNRRTRTTRLRETHRLRTWKIPPYVVEKLQVAMAGQDVLINQYPAQPSGSIDKNNEIGQMWTIDTEIELREDCPKVQFGCV